MKGKRVRPTHFLSIPLEFSTQFKENYNQFIRYFELNSNGLNIASSSFQPFNSLHLTLGVMNLSQPDQLNHACKLLLNDVNIGDDDGIQVAIDQLDYFGNGRILYGKPRGPHLVDICTQIRRVFIDAGLLLLSTKDDDDDIKLHCTFLRLKKPQDLRNFIKSANQSNEVLNLLPLVKCPSVRICKMTQQECLNGGYRVEAELTQLKGSLKTTNQNTTEQ